MKHSGKVITVSGPIDPASMGVTLTHEHLLINCITWFRSFPHQGLNSGAFDPVTPENAAWLRQFPYYSRENMINSDWQLSATELRRFKISGGGAVIDASSLGCGRDVWALRKIADDVGMPHRCGIWILRRRDPSMGHGRAHCRRDHERTHRGHTNRCAGDRHPGRHDRGNRDFRSRYSKRVEGSSRIWPSPP